MQTYSDIIDGFPQQMQLPMLKLIDRFREETLDTVKRSDFEELKAVLTALGERVSDLALAQKNSEKRLTRVEVILQELAEAQKNSEKRLTRVEVILQELAEAQRNTEKTLRTVVKEQKKIRKDFGGLSDSIGYGLEDRAIKGLPALLRARAKINSHFPISASGHLRSPLNREVIEIVHYSCGFTQSRQPNLIQI